MSAHAVHFYEDEAVFIDGLAEFAGSTLVAGGACVIIATAKHLRSLTRSLRNRTIDLRRAIAAGRFIALDAQDTLSLFMIQDRPDPGRFYETMEPILDKARKALVHPNSPLSAFGEMVALLWANQKREAAIELEHLWNELEHRYKFNLRCAYPMAGFSGNEYSDQFHRICSEHSSVIPVDGYPSLKNEDDRHRMVSSLQQKALAVQAVVQEREKEVAHRKEVEEKLRRTEELTRSIIESSVDCIKVLTLDGRIQYMSPPGQRALEVSDAIQFLNHNWVDFWREEDKPRAQDALTAAASGGVGCFQGDACTFQGKRKSWDVRITPALGKTGQIESLVAVSRDITELRTAQQLAVQAEKLAAAGRLAATIAHEINNPLEAVTNFIYLSRTANGLPEEVSRYLEIADRELARVAQIAQQTLGFYRDNSKQRWISMAELVHDVMIVYERKIALKRLQTQVKVDPDLKIFCKHGELRQALSNLLANAIDASRESGRIWLRARASSIWSHARVQGVRITLADDGIGMSPDVQKRIFVPFLTTKAEIGTGIGLWATKTLIEQQRGQMRFRSRQSHKSGTVMSVFLPHAQPAQNQNPARDLDLRFTA